MKHPYFETAAQAQRREARERAEDAARAYINRPRAAPRRVLTDMRAISQ